MKTTNLFMAMAALFLAACSENEVIDVNPDAHPAISMDFYTGVKTKVPETTTTTLKGNVSDAGFGILAYKTANAWSSSKTNAKPEFMYNEHATWTNGSPGSWSYPSAPLFWPTNSDKITFFAYAPYESAPDAGTNNKITLSAKTKEGAPEITFEVKTSNDWKDMVDLVVDGRTDIQDQTSATTSTGSAGTVKFKFSHILTKIADIKVKPDQTLGSNTKLYVTGLKLVPGTDILQSKAIYKFENGEWAATSPAATYFSGDQNFTAFLNKTTPSNWGYTTSSVDVSNNSSATSLFQSNEALYFIPVNNGSGTTSSGDLKLKISYDLVSKVDDSNNITSSVTDKEVELPAGTFKKGTAHTYTLTIKMNTIKIDVDDSWTNWTSGTDSGIDVAN